MPEYKLKTGRLGKAVVDGYKKVENGVVGGYKTVENGVVNGYRKIEDKFVETFLTEADGEKPADAGKQESRESN